MRQRGPVENVKGTGSVAHGVNSTAVGVPLCNLASLMIGVSDLGVSMVVVGAPIRTWTKESPSERSSQLRKPPDYILVLGDPLLWSGFQEQEINVAA
jgi:hypothetical protein